MVLCLFWVSRLPIGHFCRPYVSSAGPRVYPVGFFLAPKALFALLKCFGPRRLYVDRCGKGNAPVHSDGRLYCSLPTTATYPRVHSLVDAFVRLSVTSVVFFRDSSFFRPVCDFREGADHVFLPLSATVIAVGRFPSCFCCMVGVPQGILALSVCLLRLWLRCFLHVSVVRFRGSVLVVLRSISFCSALYCIFRLFMHCFLPAKSARAGPLRVFFVSSMIIK
jgi:hypothetical protein